MKLASIALFLSLALAIVCAALRARISSVSKHLASEQNGNEEGPAPEAPIGHEEVSKTKDSPPRFTFGGVEAGKNNRAALRAEVEKFKEARHEQVAEPAV